MMLTLNEKKVLRLLMAAFGKEYSINNIAKECCLAPNGAYKILKKFEREGILKLKAIANIKSYRINFNNEKTHPILELALLSEIEGRVRHRFEDLQNLKKITKTCIIFGSYAKPSKKFPKDMDIFFILDKNRFKDYKKHLTSIKGIVPVKIHDVLQTEEDVKNNILTRDPVLLEILRKGVLLWGQRTLVGIIKNVSQSQTKKVF